MAMRLEMAERKDHFAVLCGADLADILGVAALVCEGWVEVAARAHLSNGPLSTCFAGSSEGTRRDYILIPPSLYPFVLVACTAIAPTYLPHLLVGVVLAKRLFLTGCLSPSTSQILCPCVTRLYLNTYGNRRWDAKSILNWSHGCRTSTVLSSTRY